MKRSWDPPNTLGLSFDEAHLRRMPRQQSPVWTLTKHPRNPPSNGQSTSVLTTSTTKKA